MDKTITLTEEEDYTLYDFLNTFFEQYECCMEDDFDDDDEDEEFVQHKDRVELIRKVMEKLS